MTLTVALCSSLAAAQAPPPPAVDVTGADITAFLDRLRPDRVSDLPIRIADVGGYKVGIYGVFRPKGLAADGHRARDDGIGDLLHAGRHGHASDRGNDDRPEGRRTQPEHEAAERPRQPHGVTRRVVPGDVVIIPGRVPHWWSQLDNDIRYLIFRPDPEGLQPVK